MREGEKANGRRGKEVDGTLASRGSVMVSLE